MPVVLVALVTDHTIQRSAVALQQSISILCARQTGANGRSSWTWLPSWCWARSCSTWRNRSKTSSP